MESTDCTKPLAAQPNVAVTPSPAFGLTGSETNSLGYTQPFCYRCGVLPTGQTEIWFDKVLTVTGLALDCSNALTDAGFASPPAIAYNSAGSSSNITEDYTKIFAHS